NVIERLVIMADQTTLDLIYILDHLHRKRIGKKGAIPETLKELKALKKQVLEEDFGQTEKAFLIQALKASNGNVTRAAKKVGMQRSNFHALMKKHNISAKNSP
ncbi:MAG: sigma-54-dependent Fis family transcriptional regulator, partial [Deltaproteobacteria bacterium]|nr:sigma-54-dependent Fis family transcriptional regulator [Deltaproteobacteria bacterium]